MAKVPWVAAAPRGHLLLPRPTRCWLGAALRTREERPRCVDAEKRPLCGLRPPDACPRSPIPTGFDCPGTHASEIRLTGEPGLTSIQTFPLNRTLFDVSVGSPRVAISGITFRAPLKISGGDLRLTDCAFEGSNHANAATSGWRRLAPGSDADGGALHVSNELSTVTVANTDFSRCSARHGGAVYAAAGTATFSNCVFRECEAAGYGGAMHVSGLAKVVLRGGTTLYSNLAADPSDATKSRLESIHIASTEERALMYQLPAPLGHYIDSFGQPELQLDQDVWYNDFPPQCAAGFYGADDSLSSQSSTVCSGPCPEGKYCISSATIIPTDCEAGGYCPAGSPAPRLCPSGTFGNETAFRTESQCHTCSASTSCTRGSTSETPCNPGRFSANERQATCDACDAGTFQDSEGQTECKVCLQAEWLL